MIISVLGDTFADIVCRPLEQLPTWGTVSLCCSTQQTNRFSKWLKLSKTSHADTGVRRVVLNEGRLAI